MTNTVFTGINRSELAAVLARGTDHGGNPIEVSTNVDAMPLRCCLGYSSAGERVALLAWSPFAWQGVYAETGPIFVHADPCQGPDSHATLPAELDSRAMVLRPYTPDNRIAYDHVRHVGEGQSLAQHVTELLDLDDVVLVHGRNVTGGCFSFSAQHAV